MLPAPAQEIKESPLDAIDALTATERKIFAYYAYGFSVAQISEMIHRSEKTITKHRENIGRKLGVTKNTELAVLSYATKAYLEVEAPIENFLSNNFLAERKKHKMNWWVSLCENNMTVNVDRHEEGGIYVAGGTEKAEINITYNYSEQFIKAGLKFSEYDSKDEPGLLAIHGKAASGTIEALEKAVKMLGTERYSDYWRGTEGNAGYTLSILLKWAKSHPNAIWKVG